MRRAAPDVRVRRILTRDVVRTDADSVRGNCFTVQVFVDVLRLRFKVAKGLELETVLFDDSFSSKKTADISVTPDGADE